MFEHPSSETYANLRAPLIRHGALTLGPLDESLPKGSQRHLHVVLHKALLAASQRDLGAVMIAPNAGANPRSAVCYNNIDIVLHERGNAASAWGG